jgi:hypothetical protein
MSKMEPGLYDLLAKLLKEANHPMTCVELYDVPDVRALANSPNRVSDYLGGLWRKGVATREPFTRTNLDASRWAYAWREPSQARREASVEPGVYHVRSTLVDKPNVRITEQHDMLTIELAGFTVTVKMK